MTSSAISKKRYTLDEYIEFEEKSEIRHEFHEGFLYPIDGTSGIHNEVIQNVMELIRPVFRQRGCKIYHESVKVELIEKGKYVYPDILLTCDDMDKNATYIVKHPSLIIEVLSKSTAEYDKGPKFNYYQNVLTIQYYLLVESRWQSIELYSRTDKKGLWTYQRFSEPTEIIEFPKLDFQLTFKDIYQDLDIPIQLTLLMEEEDEIG
jgi:Uma2 family endonuclease